MAKPQNRPAEFGDFEVYPTEGGQWASRHNLEESSTARYFGTQRKAVGHAFKKMQPGQRVLIFNETPEYEDQRPDRVIRKSVRR